MSPLFSRLNRAGGKSRALLRRIEFHKARWLLLGALGHFAAAAADDLPQQASSALENAGQYFRSISTEGGYLWHYSPDLKQRAGERSATVSQIWVQPPGTPSVGMAFLRAYQATQKPICWEAALAAADALARGQLESGGWDYLIDFDPEQGRRWLRRSDAGKISETEAGRRRNITTFDDDNTQSALRFLMSVAAAGSDPSSEALARVREALEYGLGKMLDAQYPNGAWPQRYDGASREGGEVRIRRARFPEAWSRTYPNPDYRGYYTFNDNTHRDCIRTLLQAFRQFGRAAYLDVAKKGGEFILLAQLPEPQPAWAQQYNEAMEPAWARKFEPPSVSGGESGGVIRTLLELYLETGDNRFFSPVAPAIQWYQRSEIRPGIWARFYELRTNRPLYFTKDYLLDYRDDDLPDHYSFQGSYGVPETIRFYEEVKRLGREEYLSQNRGQSLNSAAKKRKAQAMAGQVQSIVGALDEQGRWITNGRIESRVFIQNMETLSDYLELAR